MKMVAFFSFCFIREKKGEVELTRIFGSRSRSSRSHFSRQRPPLHTHTHIQVCNSFLKVIRLHINQRREKKRKNTVRLQRVGLFLSHVKISGEREREPPTQPQMAHMHIHYAQNPFKETELGNSRLAK